MSELARWFGDREQLDGDVTLPGVRHCDLVGQRGVFVSIYSWTGDHTGRTREALRLLKEYGGIVVVQDPGSDDSSSRTYWNKMAAEGLVDEMYSGDDEKLPMPERLALSASPALAVPAPTSRLAARP